MGWTDQPTDRPTDRQTDRLTDLGIKAPSRSFKKQQPITDLSLIHITTKNIIFDNVKSHARKMNDKLNCRLPVFVLPGNYKTTPLSLM